MAKSSRKQLQLQIRVSAQEKSALQAAAARAGMDMSSYVLSRVLPAAATRFRECVLALSDAAGPAYGLAELNALLAGLSAAELRDAVEAAPPRQALSPFVENYLAAMVESACAKRALPVPEWVRAIAPLPSPVFGSSLASVRLYLLTHSPAAFRGRNIFVDTDIGSRV